MLTKMVGLLWVVIIQQKLDFFNLNKRSHKIQPSINTKFSITVSTRIPCLPSKGNLIKILKSFYLKLIIRNIFHITTQYTNIRNAHIRTHIHKLKQNFQETMSTLTTRNIVSYSILFLFLLKILIMAHSNDFMQPQS